MNLKGIKYNDILPFMIPNIIFTFLFDYYRVSPPLPPFGLNDESDKSTLWSYFQNKDPNKLIFNEDDQDSLGNVFEKVISDDSEDEEENEPFINTEWEDDDDPGYVMIEISEREFNDLNNVKLIFYL